MIVDAHCHAWENWPYQPPVPDSASRASAEQLLYEMDLNGVEQAVLICARLGDNAGNVDYAVAAAARHPGRLVVFPDLESRWSPEYRTPGAAGRMEQALARWDFVGFTIYLAEAEDGSWLTSEEGRAFFTIAAQRRLIASLSIVPQQMPAVLGLAQLFPQMPLLLHHHGLMGPRAAATPNARELVLSGAARPNVMVKVSGMGNIAAAGDEYPYDNLGWVPLSLLDAYGADRLIWGSDYPVSRRHMTYKQTLALATRHGPYAQDLPKVIGGNMARLLDDRRGI